MIFVSEMKLSDMHKSYKEHRYIHKETNFLQSSSFPIDPTPPQYTSNYNTKDEYPSTIASVGRTLISSTIYDLEIRHLPTRIG